MKNRFAVFVSCSWNYVQYVNALLNSLDFRGVAADIYLIHHNFPDNGYLQEARRNFPALQPLLASREAFCFDTDNGLKVSDNLFLKQCRFRYVSQLGGDYDAIVLLDADMFIVSRNFNNLFELVSGTNKLIGCNERFKWVFNETYVFQNRPVLPKAIRAMKFHCSVPIVFNLRHWEDVFSYYNQLAFNAYQISSKGIKWMGDMETWNIAVYKHNRQDDVVLFPMETMTQVHGTNALPGTRIRRIGDDWFSDAGDEVFSIHGRVDTVQWEREQHDKLLEYSKTYQLHSIDRLTADLKKVVGDIRDEWNELNFKRRLKLSDYTAHQAIPF